MSNQFGDFAGEPAATIKLHVFLHQGKVDQIVGSGNHF